MDKVALISDGMKKSIKNTLWGAALVGSFFVGSHFGKTDHFSRPADKLADQSRSRALSGRTFASGRDASGLARSDRPVGLVDEIFKTTTSGTANLETLATEAFSDPNQVKRRLAFGRILESLTPENAAATYALLLEKGMTSSELRDFSYAWGALAGAEAFVQVADFDRKDSEMLMSGWASVDPAGAMDHLDSLGEVPEELRRRLESGIVAGLADRNPDEATAYVKQLADAGRRNVDRLMSRVTTEVIRKEGPVAASTWVTTLEDGPLKGNAMREVAERYVDTDPQAAAAWIEEFAETDYAAQAVARVGREWAEKEPLAAVSWLDQLPEGPGQREGLNSAFSDWEDRDPTSAGEYLLAMPDSPKRDSAIRGFAEGYAWQDPETAIAWAQDIRDPQVRAESLKNVGYAYYRRRPEEARLWLAQSGLTPEVQQEIQQRRRRR